MSYEILLYYKYVDLESPEEELARHKALATELDLKGRIIISQEGINGTVEGTPEATAEYSTYLSEHPVFKGIDIKRSQGTGESFPKLSIRVRPELVSAHLGEENVNPTKVTGKYVYADELHEWFVSGKEFYVVDMRNDYEHKVGYFQDSVLAQFANFRDLPKVLGQIAHLKDKTIVTVCTGGVRCEKASGFLLSQGFSDVYQLYGGIVTYMEKYPNQNFLGKLYVFDSRIIMGFNSDSPDYVMVGRCDSCGSPSENYINCANLSCHRHFICCEGCLNSAGEGYCKGGCDNAGVMKNHTGIDLTKLL